jgi:alkylation response protein AidB-like acyl-CoA dehydrogenase
MDITYPERAERFRADVRVFLAENLPPDWHGLGALGPAERDDFERSWRATLARNNMLAVSWPAEFGGAGLSPLEQVVVAEEFERAGAPAGTENDGFGIGLLGNTLLAAGTDEQKSYFLPRILSGEHVWCQGYSEPDAGSDLAGLRTRAVLDGDEWVINGQKIWTSAGSTANWIFVIARTDPDVPKHKGLSFLLVPIQQPGVEVRPIRNAAGYELFCEVFFTDARASAAHVIGGVNNGWSTAMVLLGFERGAEVTTDPIRYRRDLDRLLEIARERGRSTDPRIRDQLAWCFSRVEIMRYRGYRGLTRFLAGARPGADGAISKLIWSEYFQRYTDLAVEIIGADVLALTGEGNGGALKVADVGTENSSRCWSEEFLHARAATIYAGSTQVQRTVIGEQLLGLPKEPRLDGGPFRDIGRPVAEATAPAPAPVAAAPVVGTAAPARAG